MTSSLPADPSLEHLRKQAKKLHRAHQQRDHECLPVLRLLPKCATSPDDEIFGAKLSLQEVQHALALEYGFDKWSDLKDHVQGGEARVRTLEDLNWNPESVSYLGCLLGCLEYLGIEVTDDWLYGASGHAFIMNMHEVVCPSGPTAWNASQMARLCWNVGCRLEGLFAHKSQVDFADKQKMAWEKVRGALDQGLPCIGWEFEVPEFYLIYGYDETGYYYRGPTTEAGKGPKPWRELGDTGIGALEITIVSPGEVASPEQTAQQGLRYALWHAGNPPGLSTKEYRQGIPAYDTWISALKENKADAFGQAYNSVVWVECRHHAVGFLREARSRLDSGLSSLFDEAIGHYDLVRQTVGAVSDLFPFSRTSDAEKQANINDERKRGAAVDLLTTARNAEEKGLKVLAQIAERIET